MSGLARARAALVDAELAGSAVDRYLLAHLAALRVAAELLAATALPAAGTRPNSVWGLVAVRAPEFAEWAGYFAAIQGRRRAAAAGGATIGQREADDLVRDATAFYDAARLRLSAGERSRLAAG